MRKEILSRKDLQPGTPARASLLVLALIAAAGAQAEPNVRLTPFLRQQAMPQERLAPAMALEPMRRPESDEARNQRRWSPEERRQLRRDVHDAGRDVYGMPPRRPD